jgi:hypothetical protein
LLIADVLDTLNNRFRVYEFIAYAPAFADKNIIYAKSVLLKQPSPEIFLYEQLAMPREASDILIHNIRKQLKQKGE